MLTLFLLGFWAGSGAQAVSGLIAIRFGDAAITTAHIGEAIITVAHADCATVTKATIGTATVTE